MRCSKNIAKFGFAGNFSNYERRRKIYDSRSKHRNCKRKTRDCKNELSEWLLQRFYGELSIAVSCVEACQQDFEEKQFKELQRKLHESLGKAKLQQFDLCHKNAGVCESFFDKYDNSKGICCFDGKTPAEANVPNSEDCACNACLDILSLGENLTTKNL